MWQLYWSVAAIFKMAAMNFQLLLANNIDRKFIFVYLSLLSGAQNPNMVIILACGVCGSHLKKKWPMRIFNVPYLGEY